VQVSVSDRVRDLVAPVCTDLGLEIYDVEHASGKVRVTVDRPGGVDLAALAVATRLISRELDERDPIPGGYQLEVSSPGLERPLRTPAHFQRAVGRTVSLRLHPSAGEVRRISGVLTEADADGVTVLVDADTSAGADGTEPATARIRLADIERARTTFAWGGQPKPGKGPRAVRTPAAPEAEETA
jgi:ribosome maturation factor RimP